MADKIQFLKNAYHEIPRILDKYPYVDEDLKRGLRKARIFVQHQLYYVEDQKKNILKAVKTCRNCRFVCDPFGCFFECYMNDDDKTLRAYDELFIHTKWNGGFEKIGTREEKRV